MGLFDGFSTALSSLNPFSEQAAPHMQNEAQSDTPATKFDPLGAAAGASGAEADKSDQLYDAYSKAAGSVNTSPKGGNFYPDDGTGDPSGLATRNISDQLGGGAPGSQVSNPSAHPMEQAVKSITAGAASLNTSQFNDGINPNDHD